MEGGERLGVAMATILKEYVQIAEEAMREHVVVLGSDPDTERVFRKAKSTDWLMRYTIVGGINLVVTGDLGSAVYRWGEPISFPWLAGLSLSYMMSKCEASEWGRYAREWDGQQAARGLSWHVNQLDAEQKENWISWRKEISRADLNEVMYSQPDWAAFADRELRDFWYDLDGIWDIGWVVPLRAVAHWRGLQLMREKLAAAKA